MTTIVYSKNPTREKNKPRTLIYMLFVFSFVLNSSPALSRVPPPLDLSKDSKSTSSPQSMNFASINNDYPLFSSNNSKYNVMNGILESNWNSSKNSGILIRKKRYFWYSYDDSEDEEEVYTTVPTASSEPQSTKSSWTSWFKGAANSIKDSFSDAKDALKEDVINIKDGIKKVGRKFLSGLRRIRTYFNRSENRFVAFANRIKKKVELGDEKAVELLRKLGIHIAYDSGSIATNVNDSAASVREVLKEEGILHTADEEYTREAEDSYVSKSTDVPTSSSNPSLGNNADTESSTFGSEFASSSKYSTSNNYVDSTSSVSRNFNSNTRTNTEFSDTTISDIILHKNDITSTTFNSLDASELSSAVESFTASSTINTNTEVTKDSTTEKELLINISSPSTDISNNGNDITINRENPTRFPTNDLEFSVSTNHESGHSINFNRTITQPYTTIKNSNLTSFIIADLITKSNTAIYETSTRPSSNITFPEALSISTTISSHTIPINNRIESSTPISTETPIINRISTSAPIFTNKLTSNKPAYTKISSVTESTLIPFTTTKSTADGYYNGISSTKPTDRGHREDSTASESTGNTHTEDPSTTQTTGGGYTKPPPTTEKTGGTHNEDIPSTESTGGDHIQDPSTTEPTGNGHTEAPSTTTTTNDGHTENPSTTQTTGDKYTKPPSTTEPTGGDHIEDLATTKSTDDEHTKTPPPFPDIFSDGSVRNRLHEVFLNADFNHEDLRNTFDFDPAYYEDYYSYY